ncbi:WXG100 family type VII secretion target [Dactylosporangium sp. CA-152071]|uniref:WXG100 family type VII secretion target n=1 Tax=Dactylosporangium sp. CA-152071 TaxID=3239933 RepID=UPI003D90D4F2
MTARTSSLLRGGDPAPGDPAAVRRLVLQLRDAVDRIGDATALIRAVGADGTVWTGAAASAFTARRTQLLTRLNTAHSAYDGAADALQRWLTSLQHAQAEAAAIVAKAHALPPADGHPSPALAALQHARDRLEARARAEARACAHDVEAATDAVGQFAHGFWQHVSDELTKDLLAANHVLEKASALLGMAALLTCWIPFAGQVFATAALATSALLVVSDALLFAGGHKSGKELLVDAGGLALGGAGGAAKGAFAAAKQASVFTAAAGQAERVAAQAERAGARGILTNAAGDADLFAALAGAARADSSAGVAFRSAVFDTVHPIRSAQGGIIDASVTRPLVDLAQHYRPMTLLEQWRPSDVTQLVSGAVVTADTGNTVREFRQQILSGQP